MEGQGKVLSKSDPLKKCAAYAVESFVHMCVIRDQQQSQSCSLLLFQVDGEFYTLPVSIKDGVIWANQEGNNIIVQVDFGLKVLYDSSSFVLVSVPSTYQGQLNGLCGNFNGDSTDDFTLPNGKITQNVDEFGASWKVSISGTICTDGCDEKCPICDADKTAPYRPESSCGMIQATSGPFKACHALVDPAAYFNNCLHDMCVTNGAGQTLCRSIQAYVAACQAAGVTIEAWRSDSFCREFAQRLQFHVLGLIYMLHSFHCNMWDLCVL